VEGREVKEMKKKIEKEERIRIFKKLIKKVYLNEVKNKIFDVKVYCKMKC